MEIEVKSFVKIFEDSTRKFKKIPKGNYLKKGRFPIIDQSQDFIAGYTDDESLVNFDNLPVIIFGDHTRALKYINLPIALGADGAKALTKKNDKHDTLFLYYALNSLKLPDAGYSRHFKFLKESKFLIPKDSTDQKRIAQVLNDCEDLISKRKESIALLDELIKSTFLEMFGDPVRNEKGWEEIPLSELTTKIGSGSTPRGGKKAYKESGISLIRSMNIYNNKFKIKNLAFIDNVQANKLSNVEIFPKDVLINITGASVARATVVPDEILPARVNQHVAILRPNQEKILPEYFSHLLTSQNFNTYLIKNATIGGATREAITKSQLEELQIPVAKLSRQGNFSKIVNNVKSIKMLYQSHLTELKNLYARLSQDAFKGELDLRGVVLREEFLGDKEPTKIDTTVDNQSVQNEVEKIDKKKKDIYRETINYSLGDYDERDFDEIDFNVAFDSLSLEHISKLIKERFKSNHFSVEMLNMFLETEKNIDLSYYSSEDLKKKPHLNNKLDLKKFLFASIRTETRLNGNPFLALKQNFYNGQEENFDLKLLPKDYKFFKDKDAYQRSGIYYNIVE